MSALEEYRLADSETTYTTPQQLSTARRARAVIAELEAALAERDRMLRVTGEDCDFTLPSGYSGSLGDWLADLRARAKDGS